MKDEIESNNLIEVKDLKFERHCSYQLKISFDIDKRFIALIPALNLNLHSKTIEFEWLIFAIYIDL